MVKFIFQERGKKLVKSGSDFRHFSRIQVRFDENSNRPSIETEKIEIDGTIEEDSEIKEVTDKFLGIKFFWGVFFWASEVSNF